MRYYNIFLYYTKSKKRINYSSSFKAKVALSAVRHVIDPADSLLSLRHQCRLLNSCRSTFYYTPIPVASAELELIEVFEKFHFEHPYYGSRRLAVQFGMSRDKAQRLMRDLHLVATYPKPKTTTPNSEHKKFSYLLRNILPVDPNPIWSTDITYIAMSRGFMYLTAIIDWYSRMILSWRISNTMDAHFCRECLQATFDCFGEPEYFNSDQGVQFTSSKYLKLFDDRATKNSMGDKGRWVDNMIMERFWRSLKYEDAYLKRYDNVTELHEGIADYMKFYKEQRIHSSLSYKKPIEVYFDDDMMAKRNVVYKFGHKF